MITRIVKLTIQNSKVENFIELFTTNKEKIASSKGCIDVELIQDIHDPRVFMTYSHWQSEQDLQTYKDSKLFGIIWPLTKSMFEQPVEVWSLKSLYKQENHSNK